MLAIVQLILGVTIFTTSWVVYFTDSYIRHWFAAAPIGGFIVLSSWLGIVATSKKRASLTKAYLILSVVSGTIVSAILMGTSAAGYAVDNYYSLTTRYEAMTSKAIAECQAFVGPFHRVAPSEDLVPCPNFHAARADLVLCVSAAFHTILAVLIVCFASSVVFVACGAAENKRSSFSGQRPRYIPKRTSSVEAGRDWSQSTRQQGRPPRSAPLYLPEPSSSKNLFPRHSVLYHQRRLSQSSQYLHLIT